MRSGLLGIFVFFVIEALIFRTRWYEPYLEPESAAAKLTLHLHWLKQNRPPSDWKEVAVIGDSRIAEGFSGKIASELPGLAQNYFWSFGLHGTTPRIWYYFLRDADPHRNQFSAVVFALNRYSDEDSYDALPDRIMDLNFVVDQLRIPDSWEFSRSMKTPQHQGEALLGASLKGWTLRRDVRAFLQNIPSRLKSAELARTKGYGFQWDYKGVANSLRGLSVDPDHRVIHFPAGLSLSQEHLIQDTVLPVFAPPTGEITRYRTFWFNKILDLYRGSHTRIIFVQLPRAPLTPIAPPFPATFIDSVRGCPNVIVVPPETFQDLETPDNFFDGLHMNRNGRQIFSERMATIVDRELRAR
jgi:hypothetical protein